MNVNDMFPKRYASGLDLNGKAATLTIAHLAQERMYTPGVGQVEKWIVYFQETRRGVVMSRILAGQIAAALGTPETDQWAGKRITLYPETIAVAGSERVVIRAKPAAGPTLPPTAYTITTEKEAE